MNKFKLNHCPTCNSMTNHVGDVCQRCKKITDKIRKEEREKDIKVVWNAVCAKIEKEAYEQGFKDACENWEKIIRRVDAGNPKNQKSQKHNLGFIDTYSKDYILALAEKENLTPKQ